MPSVQWRDVDGLRYLHIDYRGATPDQMLEVLAESSQEVIAAGKGALFVVDVTGAPMTPAWLAGVKRANHDFLGPLGARGCVLGVDGLKAGMLRGFNFVGGGMRALPFRTLEAALAHLRAQAVEAS